ncbi:CPBP family intramembrane metalloprotease [Candidatus Saccharibacteria bacterium]|nr:CPBP family intramembrane metalloprotease [Candidatus Saccharibacteria bacterium]
MEKKSTKKKESKKELKINFNIVGKVVCLLAWVAFVSIAMQYIVGYPMLWILGKATFATPLWTTIYSAVTYILTAVVVIIVPVYIKKSWKISREELGLSELPTFTDIGLSVLGFVATIIISGVILNILQGFHLVDSSQAQNVGFDNLINPFDRIVAFFALVVFAPIAEEIIFRGWLYHKLNKVTKNCLTLSIALVSILFGALHFQWNVGITVGIMSVVMCVEREFTGTIYAGILIHMIKNGVAFWMLYVLI